MKSSHQFAALFIAGVGATIAAAPASAQTSCPVEAPDAYEMTETDVTALYECLEAAMVEGYSAEGNDIAASYRDWTVTGTRPGPDASHGDRLLLTFANNIAAEVYLAFAQENVEIPVGGILAKESIALQKGEGKVGPLFIMEKVGTDEAPDYGGWLYSAIQPNGKPMKISQGFCAGCHSGFEAQDSLAYPAEELRVDY